LADIQGATTDDAWAGAVPLSEETILEDSPDDRGQFAPLPPELSREKSYSLFVRHLKDHLYREESLTLLRCPLVDACSRPGEGEEGFRARIAPAVSSRLQIEKEKLERQYAGRLADVEAAIKRHHTRLRTQRWQFWAKLGNIIWVIVETVLRATGKGRRGRPRSAEAAFRQAATEHGQQSTAQLTLEQAEQEKTRLEVELREKRDSLEKQHDAATLELEPLRLSPRKGDIEIGQVALLWLPWRVDDAGVAERVY
jgi:hypothetical protein